MGPQAYSNRNGIHNTKKGQSGILSPTESDTGKRPKMRVETRLRIDTIKSIALR